MNSLRKLYPHLAAIAGFLVIALLYFYPVLQGKEIFQSDIAQYIGMSKEQTDFRAAEKTEPYWTNSAFGGMPTYQLGAHYPHNYIKMLDGAIRFLPRPADYLFLYFAAFYVLMLVLKASPLKAFFGALAFGLSTYLIIILGVGHNAKAHAIAYMPLVVAGVIMVFRRKYISGGLLTMFAAALEIHANHFQMTYYLLIFLLILSAYFIYKRITEKNIKPLVYSLGVFILAGILAIGANATNLLATSEYAKWSTRGKSNLTFMPDGSKRDGSSALSRDYITEYSYGVSESFNLIAPRLFGGSNAEDVGTDSEVYQWVIAQGAPEDQAREFASSLPTYWGDQPIVAAPAYIGAVVFFLALIALYFDNRKIKYAFLAGAIVSLLLSWGKNFAFLTDLFIDFVPMYSSFRAVSSIQVILELCFPTLAVMGLQTFFRDDVQDRWKTLWKPAVTALGLILVLFIAKGMFKFSGAGDAFFAQNYGPEFVNVLKEDRKALYSADLLRSGVFIMLAAGVLWLYIKGTVKQKSVIIAVGVIMVGDLFFVAKRYVDARDFVSAREMREPFQMTQVDRQILQDTTNYRVFEAGGSISSARSSYFHNSIGGYHAAKPSRFQDIYDYQISKNNIEAFNMLNVKYVIQTDEKGQEFPVINPDANGNAWFVQSVKMVGSADDEMRALTNLDTKSTAIVNAEEFGDLIKEGTFVKDSANAVIKVSVYKPNYIKYVSSNPVKGFAVFSESYYAPGWNAFIDGKPAPHVRTNYMLRGMLVPEGKHTIEFRFEPQVIQTGSTVALISFLMMLLALAAGIFMMRKQSQKVKTA